MTTKELLTGLKPSVGHLWIIGCRVWARAPDKMLEALDVNVRSGVLLRCQLYGNFYITLEEDQTAKTTRHYHVREDVFPIM